MGAWSMDRAPDCILRDFFRDRPTGFSSRYHSSSIYGGHCDRTRRRGFSVRTMRGEIRTREVLIATNGYTVTRSRNFSDA